jgi:GNAT superfamily N-acetyltransferase
VPAYLQYIRSGVRSMHWREMIQWDISAVHALSTVVYPKLPEPAACFEERQRLFPAGCWVLEEESTLVGYAISHPWRFGSPPVIASMLGSLPREPDTFHIHDVALLPAARGVGRARRIVNVLVGAAKTAGVRRLSLVAVDDSAKYWVRSGFEIADSSCRPGSLESYGESARYMARDLRAEWDSDPAA